MGDETREFVLAEGRRVQNAEVGVQDVRPDERRGNLHEAPAESLTQHDVFRFVQGERCLREREEAPSAAAASLNLVNNQGQAEHPVMCGNPTECV